MSNGISRISTSEGLKEQFGCKSGRVIWLQPGSNLVAAEFPLHLTKYWKKKKKPLSFYLTSLRESRGYNVFKELICLQDITMNFGKTKFIL